MVDDVEALSLVQECRELERYKSNFTLQILNAKEPAAGLEVIRNAQNYIDKKDQTLLLDKVSYYQYLHKIAECVGWKKLWDHTLDHGTSVVKGMKEYSPNKCPLCNIPDCHLFYCSVPPG